MSIRRRASIGPTRFARAFSKVAISSMRPFSEVILIMSEMVLTATGDLLNLSADLNFYVVGQVGNVVELVSQVRTLAGYAPGGGEGTEAALPVAQAADLAIRPLLHLGFADDLGGAEPLDAFRRVGEFVLRRREVTVRQLAHCLLDPLVVFLLLLPFQAAEIPAHGHVLWDVAAVHQKGQGWRRKDALPFEDVVRRLAGAEPIVLECLEAVIDRFDTEDPVGNAIDHRIVESVGILEDLDVEFGPVALAAGDVHKLRPKRTEF